MGKFYEENKWRSRSVEDMHASEVRVRTLARDTQAHSARGAGKAIRARVDVNLAFALAWLVGRTGFEPVTNGLKVRCSTN